MNEPNGKNALVKDNVARDDDLFGRKIIAPVTLMMCWVPDKDTWRGAGSEFMCKVEVRIAKAPKDFKVRICWVFAKQLEMRCVILDSDRREDI